MCKSVFYSIICTLFCYTHNCDTLRVAPVSVCVGASQWNSLSVLARNPHKGPAREISHKTRNRRGKEGPREDRKTQSAKGSRRDQSTEQVSQEMRVGQRGDQSTEVRKVAAKTCWPTDAGLTNARRWVSIPSGFVEVSRKYTPAITRKCTESYTKVSQTFPLLCVELTQASDCLFFFSSTPRLCSLVLVKEFEISLDRDEKKPLDDSNSDE